MAYNHSKIEKKWQHYWLKNKTFKASNDFSKPKYYVLDMFPYPSGQGLHVGHPEGYTATDIMARIKRMQGFNVLHPMGWDAFGLPAEQYALKTGHEPGKFTEENINHFRRQIQSLGFSYDWDREVNTTDPKYYKWTQWIFEQMYKHGLAYENKIEVNWAPDFMGGTVVANEEVQDGKTVRGGYPVYRVPMKQWVLRITKYADKLLDGLKDIDWPENVKKMQRNWIGRSRGAAVNFAVAGHPDTKIEVFTTRADTLFGATYLVLSPEHHLVNKITTPTYAPMVKKYQKSVSTKSDLERTDLNKNKTGVFTGAYAINPMNGKKIPIWIGDYVLPSYGTGAIMAVPAHDTRDYAFAKKFDLPMVQVIKGGNIKKAAYTGDGTHINSGFLNGMNKKQGIKAAIKWLQDHHVGHPKTNYRLRDWIFSRQRYWGEPIPAIHWENGKTTMVPEDQLPLKLPKADDLKESGSMESPLANLKDWVNVKDPKTGMKGRRETNTMPQWAGSSWYYLRYCDPHNDHALASKKALKYWLPVDLYIGGAEHAVLHLLYARFWHKFLYDIGVVPTKEPFHKLVNQGMILGKHHVKMSKSKGNVVNPDDIVKKYGADTLRLYEMFMGPITKSKPWNTEDIKGVYRWVNRFWNLIIDDNGKVQSNIGSKNDHSLDRIYNATVKSVSNHYKKMEFDLAISKLMVFTNKAAKAKYIPKPYIEGFVKMIYPIAPHVCEELWQRLGHQGTITYQSWPKYDASKLVQTKMKMAVQVNGKVRVVLTFAKDASKDEIQKAALANDRVKKFTTGKTIRKVIVIPGRICNIVAK